MKKNNKANMGKQFLENRTSWAFYLRLIEEDKKNFKQIKPRIETYLLIEILKELQFMNDKKL